MLSPVSLLFSNPAARSPRCNSPNVPGPRAMPCTSNTAWRDAGFGALAAQPLAALVTDQRAVAIAIKNAREMALLPYISQRG